MRKFYVEEIAQIAHETNRAYCFLLGDFSQKPWDTAPLWQRESAINGVRHKLKNPYATPKEMHENWLAVKKANGWTYGEVKDEVAKTHPCFLPYEELPVEQQIKDSLFSAVVGAFFKRIEM